MQAVSLLIFLLIGALAGFLAGVIVRGYGFGLLGNMAVGIVGSMFGGWLMPRLNWFAGTDLSGQIISATVGAVVLLLILGLMRRIA